MAKDKVYVVQHKRRRKNITDYKKRLKMLKSRKPRLVIRKSLTRLTLQIIEYHPSGDEVVIGMTSDKLEDLGWEHSYKNVPASYLAGLYFGKKAVEQGVKQEIILDMGLQSKTKGSRIFAALKGCVDAGLKVKASEKQFPSPDRIAGKHLKESVQKQFQKIKQKIIGEKNGEKKA